MSFGIGHRTTTANQLAMADPRNRKPTSLTSAPAKSGSCDVLPQDASDYLRDMLLHDAEHRAYSPLRNPTAS